MTYRRSYTLFVSLLNGYYVYYYLNEIQAVNFAALGKHQFERRPKHEHNAEVNWQITIMQYVLLKEPIECMNDYTIILYSNIGTEMTQRARTGNVKNLRRRGMLEQ